MQLEHNGIMNFVEHYFIEKKKKKSGKKKYSHSSYFNSKKYDKGVHGTFDFDPGLVGETLDTDVDVEFEEVFGSQTTKFQIDDIQYDMIFKVFGTNKPGEKIFEVTFGPTNLPPNKSSFDILGDTKNSLKVFGAVANVLKKWIEKENPYAFFFSAFEPSRIRLYDRFAKMIEQNLNYNFDPKLNAEIEATEEDNSKHYTFTRR